MTCIVGVVGKNKVVMGADSAGVAGYDIMIRKDEKIFKNKDFLIGCTSSFRMIQLLRFSLTPPHIKKEIYEYMCTDFVNAVRNCFRNGGYLKKLNEEESGGMFLVAYKDRLFCIGSDFQVAENSEDVYAVGCGEYYAYGSLYESRKNKSVYERVNNALSAAAHYSAGVCEPFIIMET